MKSKKIKILVLFIGALSLGCSSKTYTEKFIKALENIFVGNGIALHPKKRLLLISKPINQTSEKGKPLYRIFQLKYQEGNWCCEKQVPFASQYTDYHPVFSPDGQWVYFNSNRPKPNSNRPSQKINIWRVKYNHGNWGEPEYLDKINTENHESYPTVAEDGTLYFNSDRPGGRGAMDIYKSTLLDGVHTKPVPVASLNTSDSENDLNIHPKTEFIIFNRYLFDSEEIDLFISYNKDGSWTQPIPLDTINKTGVWELTPTLSPDGNYFLYENEGKIRWHNIKDLKFLIKH